MLCYVMLLCAPAARDSFYPRYAMPARVLNDGPMSVCVRLSQVGVLSKRLNQSAWFWARGLLSTYPKEITSKFGYLQKQGYFVAQIIKLCLQHDFVARVN